MTAPVPPRRLALRAGAALIALLFVACTPMPSATPSAAVPSASAEPSVAVSPPAAAAMPRWTRHDMPIAIPRVFGGNTPNDLARFRDRFVAVGGVNGGCCDAGFSVETRALVWLSDDGETWELIANGDDFALGRMGAVAGNGDVLVAVGSRNLPSTDHQGGIDPVPAMWSSPDGETWAMVPGAPGLADVVATPAGFIGARMEGDGPEIWASPDGLIWRRVAGRQELGLGGIQALVSTEAGLFLVGTSHDPQQAAGPTDAAIWRSPDGLAWQRVVAQPAFATGTIQDLAVVGGRFVATGFDEVGPMLLTSGDGERWERPPGLVIAAEEWSITSLLARRGAFLLTGTIFGAGPALMASWVSADGVHWVPVPDENGALPGGGELSGWVDRGDRVVGVGRASRGDEIVAPTAWVIE